MLKVVLSMAGNRFVLKQSSGEFEKPTVHATNSNYSFGNSIYTYVNEAPILYMLHTLPFNQHVLITKFRYHHTTILQISRIAHKHS